jgi:hypothetical protein
MTTRNAYINGAPPQRTMMHKRDALAAELLRCQRELQALSGTGARYLGAEEAEAKKTLIITTGDVSDVDGFFALAEYAKTGASVLFITNYPHYVGLKPDTPRQENEFGLGYTYNEDTFIQESKKAFTAKGRSLDSYRALTQKYKSGKPCMHTALTDMAFYMAKKVWDQNQNTHNQKFFFCIGGINSINPFNANILKNELLVYAENVSDMIASDTSYGETECFDHSKIPIGEPLQ